jgi:hypothetical protein
MNAVRVMPKQKILGEGAPDSGLVNKLLPEHCHDTEASPFYTIEEIHIRAETITPLLKNILDFRPPEHWDIN